jgi:ADP-ribose pyrophosphatase YjhB (NUDIX family)
VNFCSDCGAKVSLQAVAGDERQRYVCTDCGKTHYQTPNVLVATYVCVGESILWIKRGIPPAVGKWAMPGGYMESDETPEGGASRELCEETGIAVPADKMILVSVSSILHMAQTHLVFRCHLDRIPVTTRTEEESIAGSGKATTESASVLSMKTEASTATSRWPQVPIREYYRASAPCPLFPKTDMQTPDKSLKFGSADGHKRT